MTTPVPGQEPTTTASPGQAPTPTVPPTDNTTPTPAPASLAGTTMDTRSVAPWDRDGQPFDPARAWLLIERLRADLDTARGNTPPTLSPAPTPALGAGDTVAADVADLRAQLARERVARRYGLDDELVELLGAGTDEQIDARGKTLAERLTAPAGSPVPRRPVEQLRGGADPTTAPDETDPNKLADLIHRQRSF